MGLRISFGLSAREQALYEVCRAQSEALVAHGKRLAKLEEWIMYNVRRGNLQPPYPIEDPEK